MDPLNPFSAPTPQFSFTKKPPTPYIHNNNLRSAFINNSQIPRSRSNTNLIANKYTNNQKISKNVYPSNLNDQSSLDLTAFISGNDAFPHDLFVLLTQQENNLRAFKNRIQHEKNKVEKDFQNFKKEFEHIIDDVKASMLAQLDLIYKAFIEKYAYLKSEMQEIRRLKKHYQNLHLSNSYQYTPNSYCSNLEMVKEIEKQSINIRDYKINQYVNDIQKKKLAPLQTLSKQVLVMVSSDMDFYDSTSTVKQFAEIKQAVNHATQHMFHSLGDYIRPPQQLFSTFKTMMQEDQIYSSSSSIPNNKSSVSERFQVPTKEVQNKNINNNTSKLQQQLQQLQQQTIAAHSHRQGKTTSHTFYKKKQQENISQTQQNIIVPSCQQFHLQPFKVIEVDHTDTVLCCLNHQQNIITGGKDSNLVVTNIETGHKIATLKAHEASICTLAVVNDNGHKIIASGSDHGCSSIVLWDPRGWNIRYRLKGYHYAAVTAIVDLGDNETLVSGSYDKKINVYNYKRNTLLYSLPNNKSAVSGIVLNSSKDKLVSCGLDSSLNIWHVSRDTQNIVDNISLERIIKNNHPICSINCSVIRQEIVIAGTKDGKIKFFNLLTGQTQKTLSTTTNGPIIELLSIQHYEDHPLLLSCSTKDNSIILTKTDSGVNSYLFDRAQLQFGCGIGPKIVMGNLNSAPILCLVSHNPSSREINVFSILMK